MRKKPADQYQLLGRVILDVRSLRANSRSLLAKVTGLSPSTVGLYVDQLIATGHITESGFDQGAMGRPKRTLALQSSAGWFAGVEFNADRIQAVRVDFSGRNVASRCVHLAPGVTANEVVNEIVQLVMSLSRVSGDPLLAIGIGVAGLVDSAAGIALRYPLIADWNDIPLASLIRAEFSVPVTLENNLRSIALAERWFGGGRDLDDYAILGPRSGFGVAIVQGGRLVRGAHHSAGEMGYWPWPLGGKGQGASLQSLIAAPAVYRRLSGISSHTPLPQDLHAALLPFAEATGKAWESIVEDFAHVVASLQMLLDPGVFLLHGPLTALGQRFCLTIALRAMQLASGMSRSAIQVIPSYLGDDAGALGAASLAMEAWSPPITI